MVGQMLEVVCAEDSSPRYVPFLQIRDRPTHIHSYQSTEKLPLASENPTQFSLRNCLPKLLVRVHFSLIFRLPLFLDHPTTTTTTTQSTIAQNPPR